MIFCVKRLRDFLCEEVFLVRIKSFLVKTVFGETSFLVTTVTTVTDVTTVNTVNTVTTVLTVTNVT